MPMPVALYSPINSTSCGISQGLVDLAKNHDLRDLASDEHEISRRLWALESTEGVAVRSQGRREVTGEGAAHPDFSRDCAGHLISFS